MVIVMVMIILIVSRSSSTSSPRSLLNSLRHLQLWHFQHPQKDQLRSQRCRALLAVVSLSTPKQTRKGRERPTLLHKNCFSWTWLMSSPRRIPTDARSSCTATTCWLGTVVPLLSLSLISLLGTLTTDWKVWRWEVTAPGKSLKVRYNSLLIPVQIILSGKDYTGEGVTFGPGIYDDFDQLGGMYNLCMSVKLLTVWDLDFVFCILDYVLCKL